MFIDETTSRQDLEFAIISDKDLYNQVDEAKFLNGLYSDSQLLEIIQTWIEEGSEV